MQCFPNGFVVEGGFSFTATALLALGFLLVGFLAGRQAPGGRRKTGGRSQGAVAATGNGGGGKTGSEIYVGNLSYEVDERELRKLFEPFGKVASARIIENKSSGKSKGFGFVEMSTPDQTRAAIKGMNAKEVRGRKLVVNEAKTQSGQD